MLVTGCVVDPNTEKIENCKDNVLILSCNDLKICDSLCNNEQLITWQMSCHGYFTNQILLGCSK